MVDTYQFAWDMMVELRKEIVETQKLRTQIIGFKITVVSALIGLVSANNLESLINNSSGNGLATPSTDFDYMLRVMSFSLPAFCSIFFDFLCDGCSLRIKRIGSYCRTVLEPQISQSSQDLSSTNFPKWEEYLKERKSSDSQCKRINIFLPLNNPSYIGNKLLTITTVIVATLSMIWGALNLLDIASLEFSFSVSFLPVLILLTLIFLWVIFVRNLCLFGNYYRYYKNYQRLTLPRNVESTSPKFELYKLVNKILQEESDQKARHASNALKEFDVSLKSKTS